jgi:hypothetical protein
MKRELASAAPAGDTLRDVYGGSPEMASRALLALPSPIQAHLVCT